MKFFINKLIFIIILSSISKISLSHEFWIDPVKYHLKNNEIIKAGVFIGDNFEGSQIGFSKKYFKELNLFSKNKKKKIKGRMGDFPALNIKEIFTGLNVIQVESKMNYIDYKGLLKFEVFSRKKGYRNLVDIHKEKNYPDNFIESYKRYAKSLVSVDSFDGNDVDTNMELELIFLDNPLKNLKESKRVLLEYQNKILIDHQVSIMSLNGDNFKKEFLKTNNEGYIEFFFKKDKKYLIDSVVIIEGSNKKKDKYAKWHSLWASYTLKTPD